MDRREFLATATLPAAAAGLGLSFTLVPGRAAAIGRDLARHQGSPDEVARDEDFWFDVGQAFTVDRSLVNLNNGGVSPAPAVVQDAMKRHLDFSNTCPPHALWTVLEPQREGVRKELARICGVDAEELAITRNASESLQNLQLGFDLKRGDEILAATLDYPRMLTAFRQRERREGVKLVTLTLPVPAEDEAAILKLYEERITDRTRLILVSHVINVTGQVMPVRAICELARKRDIPVIVDGAHSFAHLDFKLSDLGCELFGTSLHKWLFAPHGTGLLYVKRERIEGIWPLMAAPPEMSKDIRKFEEIGTHPAANALAIAEAVSFHEGIGPSRKFARMLYLRDRWTSRLLQNDRVRLHSSLKPAFGCSIATVEVDGLETPALQSWLWDKHRILTVAIANDQFKGLRVTPSVYTTLTDIDRFCEVMETAIRDGLPKKA